MPSEVTWPDIAWRLGLTVLAGVLLGINRSEHGRAAGLRTNLLVGLAAALAMILTNRLLSTIGKQPDSFAQIDPMRLPLGILTGVGFIGAGTILRRGNSIQGVTTAATLWLTTVLGFCFGAGEHLLGGAGFLVGLGTLWGLEKAEKGLPRERRATLVLITDADGPTDDEVRAYLTQAGYHPASWEICLLPGAERQRRSLRCEVIWTGRAIAYGTPEAVCRLARLPGVHKLRWRM